MLDIKFIRQNPEIVREALKKRGYNFGLDEFLALDKKRRKLFGDIEKLYARQNKIAAELAEKKKVLGVIALDSDGKIAESRKIKNEIATFEEKFDELDKEFKKLVYKIPNIPHKDVPVGDAGHNKIVKERGVPFKFSFKPKDHIELAERLDIIDFKRAAKLSGSNFILFKGLGARLERALINFMLDLHTQEFGYTEVFPPVLVLPGPMEGTGQLPNLHEDMYYLENDALYLIPTAEVPVTNIHRGEVLKEEDLPIKYAAYTPCFRREAGSYGADTRGLIRVHQFDKVELVKFVKPQHSYEELETLLYDACTVLDRLALPYRIVTLATGDMSFASAKTYDIELYAPGMDRWLEVSSCSNFEDFQARRANIRFKDAKTGKNHFVHTLNGSGVALPRLIIAILENYQQPDGSILIPEKLHPYFNGRKRITQ